MKSEDQRAKSEEWTVQGEERRVKSEERRFRVKIEECGASSALKSLGAHRAFLGLAGLESGI